MKAKFQTAAAPAVAAREIGLVSRIKSSVASWFHAKNRFVSAKIGTAITNRQILMILNLAVSFSTLMYTAGISDAHLLVCSLWFIAAGYPILKGGIDE